MSCFRSRMADLKIFCEKHLVHLGDKYLNLETTEVIRASSCSNDGCMDDLAADPRRILRSVPRDPRPES